MSKNINIDKIIKELNVLIKSHFQDFKGAYFFGSRARGEAQDYSDYDLLFTFGHKPDWREKNRIYDMVAECEEKEHIVIDAKAYCDYELRNVWTPFREQVVKEGIFFAAE